MPAVGQQLGAVGSQVLQRRTSVPEDWLAAQLARMTAVLQAGLPEAVLRDVRSREASDLRVCACLTYLFFKFLFCCAVVVRVSRVLLGVLGAR